MKKVSKKLDCAKMMPELKRDSVMKWLINQPDIMACIFDTVRKNGLIIYNEERGTWQGVNYIKCKYPLRQTKEVKRRKYNDLTGQKFGALTVVELHSIDQNYNKFWLCRCDCGKEKVIYGASLTGGRTRSCGCKGATN